MSCVLVSVNQDQPRCLTNGRHSYQTNAFVNISDANPDTCETLLDSNQRTVSITWEFEARHEVAVMFKVITSGDIGCNATQVSWIMKSEQRKARQCSSLGLETTFSYHTCIVHCMALTGYRYLSMYAQAVPWQKSEFTMRHIESLVGNIIPPKRYD